MTTRHAPSPRPLAALLACVVAAPLAAADDWPTYQHDLHHTARSPVTLDRWRLNHAWTAPGGFSFPVIAGGSVIAVDPSFEGTPTVVASFDLATGQVNWQAADDVQDSATPATVAEGLVVYATTVRVGDQWPGFLRVRDLETGQLRYNVRIPPDTRAMPVVARDPATGDLVAYVAAHNFVTAVRLGETEGTVLWSTYGQFGGFSIPTVINDAVVLASPGRYTALSRVTGAENRFHQGNVSGGGGNTVVFDADGQQLYVLAPRASGDHHVLSAYSFESYDGITHRWTYRGPGVGNSRSIALGEDGSIYTHDATTLVQIDPATGTVVRSLEGQEFAGGAGPILSEGMLWTYSPTRTLVYDLETFELLTYFPGSRGNLNTPYKTIGQIADGVFVMNERILQNGHYFRVYLEGEIVCRADYDGDRRLTLSDFVAFRNAFFMGEPPSDFNGDGVRTLEDFLEFRNAYVAGCPW